MMRGSFPPIRRYYCRYRLCFTVSCFLILIIPISILLRLATFFYKVTSHDWAQHLVTIDRPSIVDFHVPKNVSIGADKTGEVVPAIIHQTWKSSDESTMPDNWRAARYSCQKLNPDFVFQLWTDEDARNFIEREFGKLALANYDSYPYSIERVDAFRYYLLYRLGGIYMDLDVGCHQSLRPLLRYEALFPETDPAGISNDFMVSRPGHPFFASLIKALPDNNWRYLMGTKYPTVMFSTGPAFVDLQLLDYYQSSRGKDQQKESAATAAVHLLRSDDYGNRAESFLYHTHGSSWHGNDAAMVFWLQKHWGKAVGLGVFVVVLIFLASVYIRSKPPSATVRRTRWQRDLYID